MKLQQYLTSFNEPLRAQDVANLVRLLSCRNKTARGLSDTIGPVDVRLSFQIRIRSGLRRNAETDDRKENSDTTIPSLDYKNHGAQLLCDT